MKQLLVQFVKRLNYFLQQPLPTTGWLSEPIVIGRVKFRGKKRVKFLKSIVRNSRVAMLLEHLVIIASRSANARSLKSELLSQEAAQHDRSPVVLLAHSLYMLYSTAKLLPSEEQPDLLKVVFP
ncbi:hypothetical protein IFM89_007163 [Coptis chinensis]|uniref:Uncharacterized protein n=1 Tax=Coptis chinensis TaxID=261450 RepID=A0A835LIJ4_9MAGN|nr:hypothetical protein IFM89_007163 [Coptis chinensis]